MALGRMISGMGVAFVCGSTKSSRNAAIEDWTSPASLLDRDTRVCGMEESVMARVSLPAALPAKDRGTLSALWPTREFFPQVRGQFQFLSPKTLSSVPSSAYHRSVLATKERRKEELARKKNMSHTST